VTQRKACVQARRGILELASGLTGTAPALQPVHSPAAGPDAGHKRSPGLPEWGESSHG